MKNEMMVATLELVESAILVQDSIEKNDKSRNKIFPIAMDPINIVPENTKDSGERKVPDSSAQAFIFFYLF